MRVPWVLSVIFLVSCGGSSARSTTPVAATPPPAPAEPTEPPPAALAPPAEEPPPPPPVPEAPAFAAPATPRPHVVAALAQVPAGARYVAGIDAARLAPGPLGAAVRAPFMAIAGLLPPSCKAVGLAQFPDVVVAGAGTGDQRVIFLGPALTEKATGRCISEVMLKKNDVTIKRGKRYGRTVYSGGPDDGFVAWTKASGPILTDQEDWLVGTLDPKAAKAGADLVALATAADHGRMLWFALLATPAQLERFKLPAGLITGPIALRLGADVADEVELDVVIDFATAAEAANVAALVRAQIADLRNDPQAAAVVSDVALGVHDAQLRLIVHLDAATTAAIVQQLGAAIP